MRDALPLFLATLAAILIGGAVLNAVYAARYASPYGPVHTRS